MLSDDPYTLAVMAVTVVIVALGALNAPVVTTAAVLMPLAIAGTFAGI